MPVADDHVEAVPDYALDEIYAEPEPRIGPQPGQGRDSKLFEYWGIPSYDEVEENLKGKSQAESIGHIEEILANIKKRSQSLV